MLCLWLGATIRVVVEAWDTANQIAYAARLRVLPDCLGQRTAIRLLLEVRKRSW
jgi:hypothetical protein